MNNAHHILPATCFKKSMTELSDEKKTYIDNCKLVTPWNINHVNNMIGLPHLRALILYAQDNAELSGKETGYIAERMNSFKNRTGKAQREAMLAKLNATTPMGHPVHLPVSWGHTPYNHAVTGQIKTQIWDPLEENKKEHKINPQTVEAALQKLEGKFFRLLTLRGSRATLENWERRRNPDDNYWYERFTMHSGARPLG